jgi:hypothetical protein
MALLRPSITFKIGIEKLDGFLLADDGRNTSDVGGARQLLPCPHGPICGDMRFKHLPAGFVIPAQPVVASRPPSGPDWVHEIKHDGYRLIVRRDGPVVRLYSRNAIDLTTRLSAIAAAGGAGPGEELHHRRRGRCSGA